MKLSFGPELQLLAAVLLAAYLTMHLIADRVHFSKMTLFVVLLGALCLIMLAILKLLRKARLSNGLLKEINDIQKEISSLSIQEAARSAIPMLANNNEFKVVAAKKDWNQNNYVFSPALSDFFSQYAKIEAVFGDLRIDSNEIKPFDLDNTYLRIGFGSEHVELLIMAGHETVYEAERASDNDKFIIDNEYPSIYHVIVAVSRLMHP